MNIFKIFTPVWVLRLTLGAMYIYSGYNIFSDPSAWKWVIIQLPQFIKEPIAAFGVERFLQFHGIFELAMAAVLILWFMPRLLVKLVGLISAIEMASIVFLVGVDPTTFRDIGLIGPGLAIFLLMKR